MAIPSGMSAQLGIKKETVYGTPVTPDKFIYLRDENIQPNWKAIDSAPAAGLVLRTSQTSTYISGAGGDTNHDVYNKGMGRYLEACIGTPVTAQVGATAEYTHTFTPDVNGGYGIFHTMQVGRPDVGGTVRPFTWTSAKVTGWELKVDTDGNLQLKISWVAQNELTATALATASYPTNLSIFNWSLATVTVAGSGFFTKSFTLACKRTADVERYGLSTTLRKEPIPNGKFEYTGMLDGEFESLTQYTHFTAGDIQSIVFTNTGPTIPTTSNPYKLTVTLPACQYTGSAPNVSGSDILRQPLPFRALDDGTNPVLTLVVNNDETTI